MTDIETETRLLFGKKDRRIAELEAQLAECKTRLQEAQETYRRVLEAKSVELADCQRERDALREVLSETLTTMNHAKVFIGTNQIMHKDGRILYCNNMLALEEALAANKRNYDD